MNENTYKELQQKNEVLIKELRNQIRIFEGQKEEALSSQTKIALELQGLKIEKEQLKVRLENRLQDINNNDQSLEEKSGFLELENQNLKKKMKKLQEEFTNEKEEKESLIEDLQEKLKEKNYELSELENAKKELESQLIRGSRAGEISDGIDGMKANFEKQMKIVKKQLELKDQKLKEKDQEITKLEEEVLESQLQMKRLNLTQNRSSGVFEQFTDETLRQKNEELELKLLNKEEEFMEKIEEMQKEIEAFKTEAISGVKNSGKIGLNSDNMELAALSVENQKLKKALKEKEKGSSGGLRGNGDDVVWMRENEVLKKKMKEIEIEKQKIYDELINIKVEK